VPITIYVLCNNEATAPCVFDTEQEALAFQEEVNAQEEHDAGDGELYGPWPIIVPGPDPHELLEQLDNVTATLETLLTWYGSTMPPADYKARTKLANAARALCDKHLRPAVIDGDAPSPEGWDRV
jgi:hypothetical protein